MATRSMIDKLKKIDQTNRDAVFGYTRQKCHPLLNENSIPQLINYLCLMYFYSCDWDKSTINACKFQLQCNTLMWTKKNITEMYNISLLNNKHSQWTFRINQIPSDRDLTLKSFIGLRKNDLNYHLSHKYKISYGFRFMNGSIFMNYIRKFEVAFDDWCDIGDVITMKLVKFDTDKEWELQYRINANKFVRAFQLFPGDYTPIVCGATGLSITVY